MTLEIVSPDQPSPCEPLVCPGLLDHHYMDNISILLGNIRQNDIHMNKGQLIARAFLTPISTYQGIYNIGSLSEMGLSVNEIQEQLSLDELLNKFKDIFAVDKNDFGQMVDTVHSIDVGDAKPFRSRPYRKSQVEEQAVSKELSSLLSAGLLTPSKSPWASPLLLIRKKDGGHRIVMDYRKLNSLTKKDLYPIPCIDDTLKRLGGSQYFSAMDLASGYWQIELSKEDCEKCALITSEGLFEPTRMPQGLCNAPATFQRSMDNLLGDLKLSCVLVYLDDITVFSCTFNDHLAHLREVFTRLRTANLKLKKDKCSFLKNQLEFLGHHISAEGIQPQSSKLDAINQMKVPTSLRDIQVFLGMTGYYHQFIQNYA